MCRYPHPTYPRHSFSRILRENLEICIFNITVEEPKVGNQPAWYAMVPTGVALVVTAMDWKGNLDLNGAFKNGEDYAGRCFLSHSDCEEDARAVAALVESRFPNMKGKCEINWIGTTIGSHTGPGTVALFYWGKKREN